MSTDRGMDKEVVQINNGIYSGIKNNEIMPFSATWMGVEMIILSEVRQAEKDTKYHMILLISVNPKF